MLYLFPASASLRSLCLILSLGCLIYPIDQNVFCSIAPLSPPPLSPVYLSNDNPVAVMLWLATSTPAGQGPATCTDGKTTVNPHQPTFTIMYDLFIYSSFPPTDLRGFKLLFQTFFFFLEMDLVFFQSASLHPGLTSSKSNNPIKANTVTVNWPCRHQFPICHWQQFWEEFFLLKFSFFSSHTWHGYHCEFPFIILTSVECPFIKFWMPVLYCGRLSQGDLPCNDCYKTLCLWDKLDDKGGENKMASNRPPPLPLQAINTIPNKHGAAFLELITIHS